MPIRKVYASVLWYAVEWLLFCNRSCCGSRSKVDTAVTGRYVVRTGEGAVLRGLDAYQVCLVVSREE